jgi:hypothetical protein
MMFVHFLEKEGNELTVEFFQRLEQNGEVIFYTGASNRKTGQRYFWKIRKNTGKKSAPEAGPGLMSEEEEAKILKKATEKAAEAMAVAGGAMAEAMATEEPEAAEE